MRVPSTFTESAAKESYCWGLDHMTASAQEPSPKTKEHKSFPLPEYQAPLDGSLHFLCQVLHVGLEKNVVLVHQTVRLLGTCCNTICARM